MTLRLDGDSTVQSSTCHECGAEFLLVKSFVLDQEGPRAIAITALHDHGVHEAWMDVIFGPFGGNAGEEDRVTFGCRVGPVENSNQPAATAVQAAVPYEDSTTFGHKLSREEALVHGLLPDFWEVVDFLLEEEPAISHHVYGHAAKPPRTWLRRRRRSS